MRFGGRHSGRMASSGRCNRHGLARQGRSPTDAFGDDDIKLVGSSYCRVRRAHHVSLHICIESGAHGAPYEGRCSSIQTFLASPIFSSSWEAGSRLAVFASLHSLVNSPVTAALMMDWRYWFRSCLAFLGLRCRRLYMGEEFFDFGEDAFLLVGWRKWNW